MKITAKAKSVTVSPRKVRLVADVIRGKKVAEAQRHLMLLPKRGAYVIEKVLNSAIANAKNNAKLSVENLVVRELQISGGTALKRFHPSTRGRVHPYKKRNSHISITLEDIK